MLKKANDTAQNQDKHFRILLVDDNTAIHNDFYKIISKNQHVADAMRNRKESLFGTVLSEVTFPNLKIDSAYQGQEAFSLVSKSLSDGEPYSLAFVDVRMPPGWDGVETIRSLWEIDPNIQCVICTAYSDYSWQETSQFLKNSDNFLILKKPFDSVEACQMIAALTKKWDLKRQVVYQINNLERLVDERTAALKKSNRELEKSLAALENSLSLLAHQATHDTLTGLPNRVLLSDRIQQAIVDAKRSSASFSVLYFDLDNFKHINDALGHQVGDCLLQYVAKTLSGNIRESDTVARFGGDEFVILLRGYPKEEEVRAKAGKFIEIFNQPIELSGHQLTVTSSIGISHHPNDGDNAETLLKNADAALSQAKKIGKNLFQDYHENFNKYTLEREKITSALRQAQKKQEFILHYQPIVQLNSRNIVGLEALLRWQHPVFGKIKPQIFIPIAEEIGLISPIGEWVLKTACLQTKKWQQSVSPGLQIAVNVSVYQFQQKNFVEIVRNVLLETGLEPRFLELEITESLIIENAVDASQKMEELKKLGVKFSIDDFGTGYASLNYLKIFPFDKVKIDKSFIDGITLNSDDNSIVQAIIAITKTMNIEVLAEGVENKEQADYLLANHCVLVQGDYFSLPVEEKVVSELLKKT